MRRRRTALAILLTAVTGLWARADEPGWSDAEREARRDLVVEGRIVSTQRIGVIESYRWSELWAADVEVTAVRKGDPEEVGRTRAIYFERGALMDDGMTRWKRCPAYADLRPGDVATMFLVTCTVEHLRRLGLPEDTRGALFIEMGSDYRAKRPESSDGASSADATRARTPRWAFERGKDDR